MIIQPQILVKQSEIPSPSDGEWRVNFFDYDGTLVSTQYIDTGEDAVEPAMPSHGELTLTGYNNSFANIQADIDIGAEYTTTDGKTHAHLRLTTVSGLGATCYLSKDDSSTLTVAWGDDSGDIFTNTGNFTTGEHIYASPGDYVVKIWISVGNGTYGLGHGSSTTSFCGGGDADKRNTLIQAHMPAGIDELKKYVFYHNDSLTAITISPTTETMGLSCLAYCESLAAVVVPFGVISMENTVFSFCTRVDAIVLPGALASIGTAMAGTVDSLRYSIVPTSLLGVGVTMYQSCKSMENYVFHDGITSVGSQAFQLNHAAKEYVFHSTSPPTLGANVFSGINQICKIYVPDASLAAYKAASGWVTYADYIYPLSERS